MYQKVTLSLYFACLMFIWFSIKTLNRCFPKVNLIFGWFNCSYFCRPTSCELTQIIPIHILYIYMYRNEKNRFKDQWVWDPKIPKNQTDLYIYI